MISMQSTSRIYRRRSTTSKEGAMFKKDNQPEHTFFGESSKETFFKPATVAAPAQSIQRKCAECEKEDKKMQRMTDKKEEEKKLQRATDKKEEEKKLQRMGDKKEEEKKLQKKEAGASNTGTVNTSAYIGSLNGKGNHLPKQANQFFSQRMGYDFSGVKIHTDKEAADSAKEINAKAYTVGNNIVFNEGQYNMESAEGKKLMAHELAHVVQQDKTTDDKINRQVTDPYCAGPIPGCGANDGSAQGFAERMQREERYLRRRRSRMPADRRRATGHGEHAGFVERFMRDNLPDLVGEIGGIFIDHDFPGAAIASTRRCNFDANMGIADTRSCIFVHGSLNQQALQFYSGAETLRVSPRRTLSREEWRLFIMETLTHEVQHIRFNPAPLQTEETGGCTGENLSRELSEFSAIMSEFIIMYRNLSRLTPAGQTAHWEHWFRHAITNCNESMGGTIHSLRCRHNCSVPEISAWIRNIFNNVAASWTEPERLAFHTEMRLPVWRPYIGTWPF